MTATTPLLSLGLLEPSHDSDSAGTIIVGLALLAMGLGIILLREDRRSRLGGLLLMLWGGILFVPTVLTL